MTEAEELALTDAQLKARHGDNMPWSITKWRAEYDAGKTPLCYIDWRADKLWCSAQRRRGRL